MIHSILKDKAYLFLLKYLKMKPLILLIFIFTFYLYPAQSQNIIFGNRRLSKGNAIKLALFFKTDIDFWINIQINHDAWEYKFKKG